MFHQSGGCYLQKANRQGDLLAVAVALQWSSGGLRLHWRLEALAVRTHQQIEGSQQVQVAPQVVAAALAGCAVGLDQRCRVPALVLDCRQVAVELVPQISLENQTCSGDDMVAIGRGWASRASRMDAGCRNWRRCLQMKTARSHCVTFAGLPIVEYGWSLQKCS